MIPLPKTYNKNGYRFQEIERQGDVAIYSQFCPDAQRIVAYEVFEVVKQPAGEIKGKAFPAKEVTPSNSDWGQKGYTVASILAAKAKVYILQERIDNRTAAQPSTPDLILPKQ